MIWFFALLGVLILFLAFEVAADLLSGPKLRREVVVNTRDPDDKTIRGILIYRDRRWVRLEAPKYADGDNWVALDGQVNIPANNISYVQVL